MMEDYDLRHRHGEPLRVYFSPNDGPIGTNDEIGDENLPGCISAMDQHKYMATSRWIALARS